MSGSADRNVGHSHSVWRAANAAAFAAAEKVEEARKRWARGQGEMPSDEQVAEAQRLREVANQLLEAAVQEQLTRPAPL